MKTPRAAAFAGIVFAVVILVAFAILLQAIQPRAGDTGAWARDKASAVNFALQLIPVAGVAFLWFIGVLRDRLGPDEDKLFATVFLGSGVLFVGLLFVAAAATSAIVFAAQEPGFLAGATFRLARSLAFDLTSVYAMKMASVFMFTASSLIVRTGFTSRWTAALGYGLGLLVLLFSQSAPLTLFLFPLWVLTVSLTILWEQWRDAEPRAAAREPASPPLAPEA
ncbi:hypothetical protein SLNSH_20295 [Alsobacter soli]|uniref:DUF4386 domain-containing protein n=1 Tax=Alsobacter soli TaxID=2109933 RepID=A0A2T1HNG2_9HYPH|nr:hypothetical protein SLNSH_20295 [Alsobacter soli]